jgi:DMSO/TMAO reductase YedYZ molybdopterin-dependent catalytic subunit
VKAGILDMFKPPQKEKLPTEGKYTPANNLFIVDISGTPSQAKYYKNHIEKYKLIINGKVKNKLHLSYEDIKKLPFKLHSQVFECVSNPPGGDKIGRIKVKGVPFSEIFKLVKPEQNVVDIIFKSFDNYSTSVEYKYALENDPLIVYEINYDEDGKILKELPLEHGFPLRVICPDKWGYKSAKWIKEIIFVDFDYKGYWETRGWSDRAKYKVDYF